MKFPDGAKKSSVSSRKPLTTSESHFQRCRGFGRRTLEGRFSPSNQDFFPGFRLMHPFEAAPRL